MVQMRMIRIIKQLAEVLISRQRHRNVLEGDCPDGKGKYKLKEALKSATFPVGNYIVKQGKNFDENGKDKLMQWLLWHRIGRIKGAAAIEQNNDEKTIIGLTHLLHF